MTRPTLHAFTLIELLVVITIIVLLLSLLVPAMDRAIYQAELAVCGAQLSTMGRGVVQYAMDQKRWYPYRPAVHKPGDHWWSSNILGRAASGELYDERAIVYPYLTPNVYLDPLVDTSLDFSEPQHSTTEVQYITVPYFLWYGFNIAGGKGMFKMGDRLSGLESGTSRILKINYLATDFEKVQDTDTRSSHPDRNGIMGLSSAREQPIDWDQPMGRYTASYWRSGEIQRGDLDINALGVDGSVTRVSHLSWQRDERMMFVPVSSISTRFPNQQSTFGHRIPK